MYCFFFHHVLAGGGVLGVKWKSGKLEFLSQCVLFYAQKDVSHPSSVCIFPVDILCCCCLSCFQQKFLAHSRDHTLVYTENNRTINHIIITYM